MSVPSKIPHTSALIVVSTLALLLIVAAAIHTSKPGGITEEAGDALRGGRHLSVIDPVSVVMKPNVNFPMQAMLAEYGQVPLFDPNEKDPWKKELFERLDGIRVRCGPLCTINDQASLDKYTVPGAGQDFIQLKVPVDCQAIMTDADIDASDPTVPFPPPQELKPYYSMGGLVKYVDEKRLKTVYLGKNQRTSPTWTQEYIDEWIQKVPVHGKKEYIFPQYGPATNQLRDRLKKYTDIQGKRVLVIGTERPWVEAICLYLGAAHVTTLEYGTIVNEHPQITTVTPAEFRNQYARGEIDPFDIVVTFSSMEHPGLGRYGDALNPWGDVFPMARARCVTKPGGFLVLAVPKGGDAVIFNMDRKYGKNRFPLLTANWEQVDGDDTHEHLQSPYIFRNPE